MRLAEEDKLKRVQLQQWLGAPYLQYLDSNFHARLLACTRLGVVPIEIETGQWISISQAGRLCSFGCGRDHFLHGSGAITATRVWTFNRYDIKIDAAQSFFFWRGIARAVENYLRERSKKLRAPSTAPLHPVDEQDEVIASDVDRNAEL